MRVFVDSAADAGVELLRPDGVSQMVTAEAGGCPSGPTACLPHGTAGAASAASGAEELDPTTATAATLRVGGRRRLLVTAPSSITNGSASATFPAAAFAAWCAADAACAGATAGAAGSLTLSLLQYADASSFTAATLNWPDVFSGPGVTSLQLVSGVVELQFGNYDAKRDQLICGVSSTNSSCTAQLSVPLKASADLTQSFVCLRLEPSVTGNSYQAYGYPPGSSGTSVEATVVNGAVRCNTNKFGKHIIMQYKQSALLPPSPSPPPSPPPPPPLNTVGDTYTSDVTLRMTLPVALGFDTLKSNESLLAGLVSSLESSLAASLAAAQQTLLLSYKKNISSGILKISRSSNDTTVSVSVEFRLTVPAGATEGQVRALTQLLAGNPTALFSGSSYTSYFTSSATVSYISFGSSDGLSTGSVVGISLASMFVTLLLLLGCYSLYRWRTYAAILPKKPEGDWDETGVAVVPPKAARRRKVRQQPWPNSAGGADGAADAADGGGSSGLPSPPPPLPPALPGAPTAEGRVRSPREWEWERERDRNAQAAAGGPGAGGSSVKSQARLASPGAREAWS